jgi:hypothetical protein
MSKKDVGTVRKLYCRMDYFVGEQHVLERSFFLGMCIVLFGSTCITRKYYILILHKGAPVAQAV